MSSDQATPPEDTMNEQSAEATEGAPSAFGRVNVELPSDPESPEFAQAIQELKPLYSSRTEYNFMVCDQLARRGISPNGRNVRQAGSWGAPTAVGADVSAWYIGLSSRLASDQASIPAAAKRAANSLIEQLWSLATSAVSEPLQQKIENAIQELASARSQFEDERAAWKLEHSKAQERENDLAGQLEASESHAAVMRQENERLAEQLEASDRKLAELTRSIADQALQHQRTLMETEQKHQAEIERVRKDAQTRQDALQKRMDELDDALSNMRALRDNEGRQHLLAIDGFRVDLREASQRADKAQSALEQSRAAIDDLREKASAAEIAKARIEQSIPVLRSESEAFHQVMGLLRNMKKEHGECKPREKRACTHCNAADDIEKMLNEYRGPRAAPSEG